MYSNPTATDSIMHPQGFIDNSVIYKSLDRAAKSAPEKARDALTKARELKGLDLDEVATLLACENPEVVEELFETAHYVKDAIYGKRLVLFAPLYISNLCKNDCLYCAFRKSNKNISRRVLTQQEISNEVLQLIRAGQKRILLVAGDAYPDGGIDYILKAIETVYATKEGNGEIRRLNVNIAPRSINDFRRLKEAKIGTYQVFQETYHRPTYARMHPVGPKSDYNWRLDAIDRAFAAGIDDVGIGVLFGLYDYRFEVLALMHHIRHLEQSLGVGPHTISVPRLEPAEGSAIAKHPPAEVNDTDFKRIVAILRISVPYTGIIMSTRESPQMRQETLGLGVSQVSAASRTNPGGYSDEKSTAQFQLGDHRPVDEVIADITRLGYVPSFCTACYRLGRTGGDFMDLAKPGLIKRFCLPNAILTFKEYLVDYAEEETRKAGLEAIKENISDIPSAERREETQHRLTRIENGERDLYF
jgi:2-iminoacetate synthase